TIKKEVELTDGEFILDIPLSREYIESIRETGDEEFTHLRYTACTSQPDEFSSIYTLRQKDRGRKTKLAVVCTMYNEDDQLLAKTMAAVMDNIAFLCSKRGQKGWDTDSWRDIVLVVISDGIKECNPRALDILSGMGLYMEGLPRQTVNGKRVSNHIFELTTQVRIGQDLDPEFTTVENEKRIMPMQTIFMLKDKNAKKINSHRWFFNGVCKVLEPEVCVLLDVGTKPTKESLWHLYRTFQRNENVAGACGEVYVELGNHWQNLMNPLVAVQNFEYKISNILDKTLESVCGYIAVLPGAFSAYRYQALQGAPLDSYFKGEVLHNGLSIGKPNVSESNMYLAEDRILCFELVMKLDKRYILKYVKSARAETDIPTELDDLIKQRRRWLNGSFFASVYAIQNFHRIFYTRHTWLRMALLFIETIYNMSSLIYSWFSIASVYICFYFMFNLAASPDMMACTQAVLDTPDKDPFFPYGPYIANTMRGIYVAAFVTISVGSLGNKPATIKPLLTIVTLVYATCMLLVLSLIVWTMYIDVRDIPVTVTSLDGFLKYIPTNPNFMDLAISLLCTY
ncbi:Chitin synthase, class 2, partial [Rhizoclosmatium hyalinum]